MNTQEDYFESKLLISENNSKEIHITCLNKEYKLNNIEKISLENPIKKQSLSKYFEKYFIFPNDIEFHFFQLENRKILFINLSRLINIQNITKFKITSPSGEGKSISLIYFSQKFRNIVYLNIKAIYKLYESKKVEEYVDMMIYEFQRLSFNESSDSNKTAFENLFNKNSDKSPWELLEVLSNFLKDKNVTIIFEQFKEKYTTVNFLKNIEIYLNPLFRIVICSSINDKDIGNFVSNSLYKNKGQSIYLTSENQNDYFYITKLCNSTDLEKIFSEKNNNSLFNYTCNLFNYNPKYIKLIKEDKINLQDIENHIFEKMREHYTSLGIDKNLYMVNIYSKIGSSIKYDILALKTISLKYLRLTLNEESFSIEYKYPFIKNLIEKMMKEVDTKEFFNKKKYKDNNLYSNLKGNYFEYAAINHIDEIKD